MANNLNTSFMDKILGANNKNSNTRVSRNINNRNTVSNAKPSKSFLKNITASLSGGATALGTLFVVMLCVLLIYYVTKKYTVADRYNPVIISKPLEMDKLGDYNGPLPKDDGILAIGEGRSLSYSLWVYVKDWARGHKKGIIFTRYSPGESTSSNMKNNSSMVLDYNTNELVITTHSDNCGVDKKSSHEFSVPNFPLQKWNHIVYVLNGSIIDLYLNGKLARSILFRIPPPDTSRDRKTVCNLADTENDSIYIGRYKQGLPNGYDRYTGQISRFNYFSRPLSPTDVLGLYGEGPF